VLGDSACFYVSQKIQFIHDRNPANRGIFSLVRQARARINARIRRLSLGNFGDVKPIGEGVSELRIDFGPGYRVYFVQRGQTLVVLLAGGDKRTQDRDIKKALKLAREL
jgi:putative addiction module killer protein